MEVSKCSHNHHRLVVIADSSNTDIWLGDNEGFLVKKAMGKLDIRLEPGEYVIEFGLGTDNYPILLDTSLNLTEKEIKSSPPCVRPQSYRQRELQ